MKRFLALCLLLLLPLPAMAQTVVNRVSAPETAFSFPPDARLLEVYFPSIYGCDAALVRYGAYTLLIDCAGNQWRAVQQMLHALDVRTLTYALNSHPDADHIGGFDHVLKVVPAGAFLTGFPQDHPSGDPVRFKVYDALREANIPLRRRHPGDGAESVCRERRRPQDGHPQIPAPRLRAAAPRLSGDDQPGVGHLHLRAAQRRRAHPAQAAGHLLCAHGPAGAAPDDGRTRLARRSV